MLRTAIRVIIIAFCDCCRRNGRGREVRKYIWVGEAEKCGRSTMSPAVMASQVASGIGMIAGAWMFKSLMEEADHKKSMMGGGAMPMPRCPTCNGSRRVPCICKRWSDGDEGCATCGQTGMKPCSSCGGSGKGRAIPVKLRISNDRKKF